MFSSVIGLTTLNHLPVKMAKGRNKKCSVGKEKIEIQILKLKLELSKNVSVPSAHISSKERLRNRWGCPLYKAREPTDKGHG